MTEFWVVMANDPKKVCIYKYNAYEWRIHRLIKEKL